MTKRKKEIVPFFGLDREFQVHKEACTRIICNVLSHVKVLQGREVAQFEQKVADLTNRRYGIAVNSCTDALYFSLLSAGVKPGDEVLVTDFSFVASASCISRLGAKPVFVDINESYNMDLNRADTMVSSKTNVCW